MAVQNQRLQQQQQGATTKTTATPATTATTTGTTSKKAATMPTMSSAAATTSSSSATTANQQNAEQHQHHHHYQNHVPQHLQQLQQQHVQMTPTNAAAAAAANGGPRVSFNRDVHVKKFGTHPNEITNYETTNLLPPQNTPPAYHQLPADFSEEDIRKEAALVLAQAERHKSKAENADHLPSTFKLKVNPKKFHSLPNRKKKAPAKPVTRSVSDAAAAKKPTKLPSIFNIFSRKSDSHVNQLERDPRFEDSGGRRLVRSKSDVSEDRKYNKKALKETKQSPQQQQQQQSQHASSSSKQQLASTPLSPIIENAAQEKEDKEDFAEHYNRERRKSDAITDREKHESGVNEFLEKQPQQPPQPPQQQAKELNDTLVGKNPISRGIKDKILTLQARSSENMHSSQLPPEKLPLTKGITVNGMVKRLSMERFSPPPTMMSPAFSYIRPNEGISYAQLEMSDDQLDPRKDHLRSPTRDYRTPIRNYKSLDRSLDRDYRTPDNTQRPYLISATLGRPSTDRTDFSTSQTKHVFNGHPNSSSRIIIEPDARARDSFSPVAIKPTTIRISSSHSPSPWQQLSPRNLSDEDEGLGIETRKYFDDEPLPPKQTEPPIVPIIRSITPTRETDDLGYRRARLESRILTRRFGDTTIHERTNGYHHHSSSSPERNRDIHFKHSSPLRRYLSQEPEHTLPIHEPRFHKLDTSEILQKYSPERSHLDIIAPSAVAQLSKTLPKREEKTSHYRQTKYYDDGHGGVKEVYERETRLDAEGKPQVRESRHRERLDSYGNINGRRENTSAERQLLQDYEPKSFDSQFTSTDQYRSSPEHVKRYDFSTERLGAQPRMNSEEHWHSSLKRDKLQQRSFDKGDSGIENDFRKESFNGDIARWRKRTIADDIRASEAFLKKERRHTEQIQRMPHNSDNFIYRERSIDDGSHFDPHLDKYPVATSTLRRRDQQSQTVNGNSSKETTSTLKRAQKKLGGFEKVKQLFTGSSTKDSERNLRANSTTSSSGGPHTTSTLSKDKDKEKYMVKEEEMRSRYREHRTNLPKPTDIATRRRLSTPKASPLLLKRTSSDKPRKESTLAAKPEKMSWFKSLDRRNKSKSKEKLNVSVNGNNETSSMKRSKTERNTPAPVAQTKNLRFFGDTDQESNPPTFSKSSTTLKTRPPLSSSTLNRTQKYSQSAYDLDRIQGQHPHQNDYRYKLHSPAYNNVGGGVGGTRHKSSSMHNLKNTDTPAVGNGKSGNDEPDFRKRRHYSRSRELHDISESGSETEEQHKRPIGSAAGNRTLSRERLDRTHRYDENAYRRSNDRHQTPITAAAASKTAKAATTSTSMTTTKTTTTQNGDSSTLRRATPAHLMGPPKPARSAERRMLSLSRERERFPAESSGTEGESSLHSQRSIVYLHATTVGAIPQPSLRRRSMSRDDLHSAKGKSQTLQPMTRTVSRSVSMLAPWKPKLISEGYEINYSQEQNRMKTLPRKTTPGSSSTLTRTSKNSADHPSSSTARTTRRHDDLTSLRNSSTTSATKSAHSTNLRNGDARRKIK